MKKDLYTFLKSFEGLEIKSYKQLEIIEIKLKLFQRKFETKEDTIENRVKVNMINGMLEQIEIEKLVYQISKTKQHGKSK